MPEKRKKKICIVSTNGVLNNEFRVAMSDYYM